MEMSAKKSKNVGWAAYSIKQKQLQGPAAEAGNEPYPPVSSNVTPLYRPSFMQSNDLQVRSSSSVPTHSANYRHIEKPLVFGTSSRNEVIEKQGNDVCQAYEKLKELHSWADKSLIKDVMEAVTDIDTASALLEELNSSDSLGENKITKSLDFENDAKSFHMGNKAFQTEIDLSLRERQNLIGLGYADEGHSLVTSKEIIDDHAASGQMHPDQPVSSMQIMGSLTYIPVEPEWVEDDIYLIHRKDAVRMMSSASRHSKVARDAYSRGDHLSAKKYSQKAREEWRAAEQYNNIAAKEILRIRNCNNDVWRLDLHGLHATEAVQSLQDHLHKIESQLLYVAPSPELAHTASDMVRSVSKDFSGPDAAKLNKQQASSYKPRSRVLEVITGKGIHSRGQAALPSAIETFLGDNGYHYDKTRPGVIIVRPKFRRECSSMFHRIRNTCFLFW